MEDKLFDLMTKMYNELQDVKKDLSRIERLVDGLYRANEIHIDKQTSISQDIRQVQGTVEKIELKLVRNS